MTTLCLSLRSRGTKSYRDAGSPFGVSPGLQGMGTAEGLRGRKMIIVQRQEMPFLFVASQE